MRSVWRCSRPAADTALPDRRIYPPWSCLHMRRLVRELASVRVALLVLLFFLPSSAFATWSIVAVDRNTGRVAIASATCLALEEPRSLKNFQAVIVPGVGIAACQALLDNSGRNQLLVFAELKKGTDPREIVRLLRS